MARSNAIHLELPPDVNLDPDVLRLLNEKFRKMAALIGGSSASVTSASAGASGGALVFSVPGTLSVRSNATPLVRFASERQASQLVALLKQAPMGGDVQVRLLSAGVSIASVTVLSSQTAGTANIGVTIPAESLVTVDIVGVGTVFPGSDLTLLVR